MAVVAEKLLCCPTHPIFTWGESIVAINIVCTLVVGTVGKNLLSCPTHAMMRYGWNLRQQQFKVL